MYFHQYVVTHVTSTFY